MRRLRSVAGLVALALSAGGCGNPPPSPEGTQPRPDATTFGQGDFDDIPLLAGSDPLSPPTEEEGNVARSYQVRDTTPKGVLDFYVEQLADAEVVEEPGDIGANTFRGRWRLDQGRVLTVSATGAPTLDGATDGDAEVLTQYSLSLAPE